MDRIKIKQRQPSPYDVKHISSFEVPSAKNVVRSYWPTYRQYGLEGFDYYDRVVFEAACFLVRLRLGDALYFGEGGKLWDLDGYRYIVSKIEGMAHILPVTGFEDDFAALTEETE
jgi:hypothetical protein